MTTPKRIVPAPIDIELEKFRRLRAAHRRQLEVTADLWRLMDEARHSHEITVLVGPTGVGKTNLIETIEEEAEDRHKAAGSPVGLIPSVRVNAAPPQHDTFRFPSLYREILDRVDDYFNQRARLGRLRTSDERQTAAVNALRYRAPHVFCIDEAQHITYAVKSGRLQQHLDNLKWLADAIPAPMLLVGSRELLQFSLISAQLTRRLTQVAFLPYRPVPDDLPAFLGVVKKLLEAMPVKPSFTLKPHKTFFFDGAAGSVGLLKQWFNRVVTAALMAGATSVTIEDFQKHRLPLGKLTVIAQEYGKMQEGLALLNVPLATLHLALGYPAPGSAEPAPPAPLSEDGPVVVATPLQPGERTLGRDPVGTAA